MSASHLVRSHGKTEMQTQTHLKTDDLHTRLKQVTKRLVFSCSLSLARPVVYILTVNIDAYLQTAANVRLIHLQSY